MAINVPVVSRIQEVGLPTPTIRGQRNQVPDLLGAANQVSDLILKEKEKADVAAVTEAQSRARREANRLMFDPDEGFSNLKGKNAFESLEEYRDRYNQSLDGIRGDLKNPVQQEAFNQWVQNYLPSYEKDLFRHGSSENRNYQIAQSDAAVESIQEDIINHRYDPERVKQGFEELGRTVSARAELEGLDGKAAEEMLDNAYSAAHMDVLKTMLANPGETELARQYFNANKGQIEAAERAKIKELLDAKDLDLNAQQLADKAAAKFPGDLVAQSDWIKKQAGNNIDLLDAARKRADYEFTIREKARTKAEDDSVDYIYDQIRESGGEITPEIERQLQALPRDAERQLRSDAVDFATGKYEPGNEQKMEGLLREYQDDPAGFYKQDRELQLHGLSAAQRKEVMDLRAKSLAGEPPDIDKPIFKYLQTHGSIINDALDTLDLDKKSDGDREQINEVRRQIRENFDRFVATHKREPEEQEFREQVVGPVLKKVKQSGIIWDSTKRVGNLELGDEIILNVGGAEEAFVITNKMSDIPEAHSKEIFQILQRELGRPPTEAEVVARYRLAIDNILSRQP